LATDRLVDEQPTSGPIHTLWKGPHGHISAMHHPVDFLFGSSPVGFLGTADWTVPFPVGAQWPFWKNSYSHIS